MASGAYGIFEPQSGELYRAEEIDLMVVPGVAFSADGRRLGRGKGYYDRYLSRDGFRACCIGVCYDCQLREDIPAEPHDKRVEKVVAGKR
jgi:5-formyltetrahydrofolate cyclo-ligase